MFQVVKKLSMGCGVCRFRKYSVATCTSKPVIPLAIYLGLEGSKGSSYVSNKQKLLATN